MSVPKNKDKIRIRPASDVESWLIMSLRLCYKRGYVGEGLTYEEYINSCAANVIGIIAQEESEDKD